MPETRWNLYFYGIFLKNSFSLNRIPVEITINPFIEEKKVKHLDNNFV